MKNATIEQLQGVILDSITDGVFAVDESWRIRMFNHAAERITGVSREEALGRRCCEVFRSNVCERSCVLKETLETQRPIVNRAIYIVNAQGERIPISISTAILKDKNGRVIGGVETFRDLSLVETLRKELYARYTVADIIGRSPVMQACFELMTQVAVTESTVLLEGESGTGKELFARAIHGLSTRDDGPFIAVNCGALPDQLLESELFGYKAGAFTDARQDKPGRFVLADGGTIFLDEIGDISPAMQTRLLRVLQERVVEPLGGVTSVPVNVRVIAATHQSLSELVAQGRFRQDLYYRINVIRLQLPALRERREDIPLLIEFFMDKFNRLQGKDITGVSEHAMAVLMDYEYPGNVRELQNSIEHAFALCRGGMIEVNHLPPSLRGKTVETAPSFAVTGRTLQEYELLHIRDALQRHQGNRKAVADELGINPSTLYRKMKQWNITDLPG